MTKEEIQDLYRRKIIPENDQPYHFEKKGGCHHSILAYNPVCGDKFELCLDSELNILSFHGIGCAISKASTSLLLRKVEGLPTKEVKRLIKDFILALKENESIEMLDDDLQILVHFQERSWFSTELRPEGVYA